MIAILKLIGGEPLPEHEIIPLPSFGLNYILGGGLWTGRFSLIWGTHSAGKTTMFLHVLAQTQKLGYTPVIIDAEGSYTDSWAEKCGIDMSNRIYMQVNTVESLRKETTPLLKSNNKHIYLIDSINAIADEAFYEDREGIASGARIRRKLFQHFAEYLHPTNNAVFIVAQQTNEFSSQGHVRLIGKIGNAETHWSTNIIRLFGSSARDSLERDENDLIVNREIKWTIEKSKQAPIQGTKGSYWFNPQNATIDRKKEIINIAVTNGLINKTGAWFNYLGEKYHGFDSLCQSITNDQLAKMEVDLQSIDLVFEVIDE